MGSYHVDNNPVFVLNPQFFALKRLIFNGFVFKKLVFKIFGFKNLALEI